MGNPLSRCLPKDTSNGTINTYHSTVLDHISLNSVIIKATECVDEGNSAMQAEDYQEAYVAYKYAFALIDLCIHAEQLKNAKQRMGLRQMKMDLAYKLSDLQTHFNLEEDRVEEKKHSQNKPQTTLTKNNLKVPNHIAKEIEGNKKPNDMSEEAQAYKRLLDNIEVCVPKMDMSQVIGQKQAISFLEDNVVEKNMRPDLYVDSHTKGALLYGPPGNGKTTIAQALATRVNETCSNKQAPMPYFKVTTANFKSKYTGQTDITLTALFKLAEINGPSILFIDEVEELFASRSGKEGEDTVGTGSVQTFLTLLSTYTKVFFIGATNFPWLIDEALHRRLCPTYIRMPTRDDRLKLLKVLFSKLDHFLLKKDFETIADETEGYSFDDLYNLKEDVRRIIRQYTRESTYFKKTPSRGDYETTWTPCLQNEPGAEQKNYTNLLSEGVGIAYPTISMVVVKHSLSLRTPTVSKETIEKNDKFFEKGKAGVDELFPKKH